MFCWLTDNKIIVTSVIPLFILLIYLCMRYGVYRFEYLDVILSSIRNINISFWIYSKMFWVYKLAITVHFIGTCHSGPRCTCRYRECVVCVIICRCVYDSISTIVVVILFLVSNFGAEARCAMRRNELFMQQSIILQSYIISSLFLL